VNNETIPVDSSLPNPNGIEIDNLYLDMNGIIHPCCHPEDKPAPATEEEMYIEIFKYIDRIFGMIRPRRLLYMAIDGVAPRAKMNQQRSRRFRAAQEEEQKRRDEELQRLQWGEEAPKEKKNHFDSNCITPGTPFMEQLAVCLRYYITDRLNNDPGWKNVQVILSDASVPGEGEHKIMDFIRRQKVQPSYDADTKHVLYGLDADLIMLALATHEPNFWILREDVTFNNSKKRACELCGQSGHDAFQCTGAAKEKVGQWDDQSKYLELKPFVFVHISVLREYLEVEMKLRDIPFDWDLERAIDDWVFMCFFVGNDFLPHLPSLEIREGAVELLINIWKNQARNWDGYLTDSGDIRLDRVQTIMEELGKVEDETFQKRRNEEERRRIARFERKQRNKHGNDWKSRDAKPQLAALHRNNEQMNSIELFPAKKGPSPTKRKVDEIEKSKPERFSHKNPSSIADDNLSAAKKLKMQIMAKQSAPSSSVGFSMADFSAPVEVPEPATVEVEEEEEVIEEGGEVVPVATVGDVAEDEIEEVEVDGMLIPVEVDSDAEAPADDVRLWESGWKTRYYENKFQVDVGDETFRSKVVQSYIEGLCWVLKYYYQGCQSWKWFYPFHYSPFASDFKRIDHISVVFEESHPFKPIEQLLGVFPAASRAHIPKPMHFLMTDPESPIIDFYPTEFPIDLNGKKYAWQGVALLPFIDADRLLDAVKPLYAKLTAAEIHRNTLGNEVLFSSSTVGIFDDMCKLYGTIKVEDPIPINPSRSNRIHGFMNKDPNVSIPGTTYHSPLIEFNMPDIENASSISINFYLPRVPSNYVFRAFLSPAAKLPNYCLNDDDRYAIRMGFTSRGRGRGRGGAMQRFIRHGLSIGRSSNSSQSRNGSPSLRNDRYERQSPPFDRYSRDQGYTSRDERHSDRNRHPSPNYRADHSRNYERRSDRNEPRNYRQDDRYEGRYSNRSYDSRDTRYDASRPDRYDRDDRHSSRSSSRGGYQPYMGGGGYSNRDSVGKKVKFIHVAR
jgi:5'-3' exoribonuclease 2